MNYFSTITSVVQDNEQETDDAGDDAIGEQNNTDEESKTSFSKQLRKKKKISHSEERLELLKKIAERNNNSKDTLDETDHFFMSMSKIVKKLSPYKRAEIRMQISTLVGNAELEHVSKYTSTSSYISVCSESNLQSSNEDDNYETVFI